MIYNLTLGFIRGGMFPDLFETTTSSVLLRIPQARDLQLMAFIWFT